MFSRYSAENRCTSGQLGHWVRVAPGSCTCRKACTRERFRKACPRWKPSPLLAGGNWKSGGGAAPAGRASGGAVRIQAGPVPPPLPVAPPGPPWPPRPATGASAKEVATKIKSATTSHKDEVRVHFSRTSTQHPINKWLAVHRNCPRIAKASLLDAAVSVSTSIPTEARWRPHRLRPPAAALP